MMDYTAPWDELEPHIHSTRAGRVAGALLAIACWVPILYLLSGCAHQVVPVQTITQQVKVAVPAPCPVKAEYDRLKAARPVPLSQQAKPASPTEQVAKSLAQLGLYEAAGAWSDQVVAALDRCQNP